MKLELLLCCHGPDSPLCHINRTYGKDPFKLVKRSLICVKVVLFRDGFALIPLKKRSWSSIANKLTTLLLWTVALWDSLSIQFCMGRLWKKRGQGQRSTSCRLSERPAIRWFHLENILLVILTIRMRCKLFGRLFCCSKDWFRNVFACESDNLSGQYETALLEHGCRNNSSERIP